MFLSSFHGYYQTFHKRLSFFLLRRERDYGPVAATYNDPRAQDNGLRWARPRDLDVAINFHRGDVAQRIS